MEEKPFTLRTRAYVVHTGLIRRLPNGDFFCVVELQVARSVLRSQGVIISMDRAPISFEIWSETGSFPYWYGYTSEQELLDSLTDLVLDT